MMVVRAAVISMLLCVCYLVHALPVDERKARSSQQSGFDVIEGDMIFPKRHNGDGRLVTRGTVEGKAWDNKTMPYTIEEGHPFREFIDEAMALWSKHTCVRFREKQAHHKDYVAFVYLGGCWSYMGQIGIGEQRASIGFGCNQTFMTAHEIGHALGLGHEQNRPDRDEHVKIHFDRIKKGYGFEVNFKKDPNATTYGTKYDYDSIMHYAGDADSNDLSLTIETIDKSKQAVIGQITHLSFTDIMTVNLHYSCNEDCSEQPECPRGGYQKDDCECWCASGNTADPEQKCDSPTTTTPSPTTVQGGCNDLSGCSSFTAEMCDDQGVNHACPRMCGRTCDDSTSTISPEQPFPTTGVLRTCEEGDASLCSALTTKNCEDYQTRDACPTMCGLCGGVQIF